jgi:hypothetical protein
MIVNGGSTPPVPCEKKKTIVVVVGWESSGTDIQHRRQSILSNSG